MEIEHDLNKPSRLVARSPRGGRNAVVFDAADELAHVRLSPVKVIDGRTKSDRRWTAGLYVPPDAKPGERFPLVIQTHGFDRDVFAPQGLGPSANAAQPLAAQGIAVLQFNERDVIPNDELGTTLELPAAKAGYESAVERLRELGYLADDSRIGIQGWSRTGQHVYYTLQHSSIQFAAAFIADAQTGGYYEKISVQNVQPGYAREGEGLFGVPPDGEGLAKWGALSPGFNMSRIRVPIHLEAYGTSSVFFMWEAYARLLELHKPVELVVLPDAAHTLVRPSDRLASANAMLDWFAFWLQDIENSPSTKPAQYVRWRAMRD
jgi:dipeptidyl aminopeptidase/acylaminoacyl peptidase